MQAGRAEHYFASKSFTAVREVFSSDNPEKEVLNETATQHFGTKGTVYDRQQFWESKCFDILYDPQR
jgi:hypothetical protein